MGKAKWVVLIYKHAMHKKHAGNLRKADLILCCRGLGRGRRPVLQEAVERLLLMQQLRRRRLCRVELVEQRVHLRWLQQAQPPDGRVWVGHNAGQQGLCT